VDNDAGNVSMFDRLVLVNTGGALKGYTPEPQDGALGHIVALRHQGKIPVKSAETEPLYRYGPRAESKETTAPITLIPYYAWANRGQDAMEVWLPFQLN
jgi:hypothetical protein